MQGNHPIQAAEAKRLRDRVMMAIEHASPRGTGFVVLIAGPGFNTYGTNMGGKRAVLEALRGLSAELERDILHGGT